MPVRKIDYPNTGGPSKLSPDDPGVNPRVETGAVQFGDDWPGLFLRGDESFALAMNINTIVEWYRSLPEEVKKNNAMVWMAIESLDGYKKLIHEEVVVK